MVWALNEKESILDYSKCFHSHFISRCMWTSTVKFQGTPWIVSRCHADVIQWDCSKYPNVELLSLMTTYVRGDTAQISPWMWAGLRRGHDGCAYREDSGETIGVFVLVKIHKKSTTPLHLHFFVTWSLRSLTFDTNISGRLKSSWPLVGNEGMNPQYTNVKVDSLIPY